MCSTQANRASVKRLLFENPNTCFYYIITDEQRGLIYSNELEEAEIKYVDGGTQRRISDSGPKSDYL